MVQFPLVLAIEPKLLPYARANGFNMDRKVSPLTILYWLTFFPNVGFSFVLILRCWIFQYRNFVFRKMFEKPALNSDGRTEEIIRNVRELSRLDPEYVVYPFRVSVSSSIMCSHVQLLDTGLTSLLYAHTGCSSVERWQLKFVWRLRRMMRHT